MVVAGISIQHVKAGTNRPLLPLIASHTAQSSSMQPMQPPSCLDVHAFDPEREDCFTRPAT